MSPKFYTRFYPHFVLLIFYFILHQFNRSFGLLKPMLAIQYALVYAGLGLILFLLARILTKNNSTASLVTFAGVFILIFFGNYHDAVKSWAIPEFFKKYSFQLA